jgi:hypothetical protein
VSYSIFADLHCEYTVFLHMYACISMPVCMHVCVYSCMLTGRECPTVYWQTCTVSILSFCIRMHVHVCVYMYINMSVCMHVCVYSCIWPGRECTTTRPQISSRSARKIVCMYVCMYVCMCMHIIKFLLPACVFMFICVFACLCVCMHATVYIPHPQRSSDHVDGTHGYIHLHVCMRMSVCDCACVHTIYACIYVRMYVLLMP